MSSRALRWLVGIAGVGSLITIADTTSFEAPRLASERVVVGSDHCPLSAPQNPQQELFAGCGGFLR